MRKVILVIYILFIGIFAFSCSSKENKKNNPIDNIPDINEEENNPFNGLKNYINIASYNDVYVGDIISLDIIIDAINNGKKVSCSLYDSRMGTLNNDFTLTCLKSGMCYVIFSYLNEPTNKKFYIDINIKPQEYLPDNSSYDYIYITKPFILNISKEGIFLYELCEDIKDLSSSMITFLSINYKNKETVIYYINGVDNSDFIEFVYSLKRARLIYDPNISQVDNQNIINITFRTSNEKNYQISYVDGYVISGNNYFILESFDNLINKFCK